MAKKEARCAICKRALPGIETWRGRVHLCDEPVCRVKFNANWHPIEVRDGERKCAWERCNNTVPAGYYSSRATRLTCRPMPMGMPPSTLVPAVVIGRRSCMLERQESVLRPRHRGETGDPRPRPHLGDPRRRRPFSGDQPSTCRTLPLCTSGPMSGSCRPQGCRHRVDALEHPERWTFGLARRRAGPGAARPRALERAVEMRAVAPAGVLGQHCPAARASEA